MIDERVVPAMAGTIQSFTIGGLSPCTQYYVAMRTMDESNNHSEWSFNGPQITSCGGGCGGTCEARAGEAREGERVAAATADGYSASPPSPDH